jgi:ribonuclease P protein component
VGFIVPRYKHSAVDRNRLKRRLREVARTKLLPCLAPQDVVVRTRPETYGATLDQLVVELSRVLERLPQRSPA